ncbi:serine hydrolase domain-containing protein [Microvirga brassicacearum]|uniref:Beta-lactamase family protein n=1 Tax=Microvirga brassicacearum TaxID=2580413 RepID=A0A5N3PDE5_9HYPH|nr:serine hydrolase domain-containing protein [Microvirga brassicacearum]KAB0267675.1 beta-lactamase family protein [Microvirga brassicacearum]
MSIIEPTTEQLDNLVAPYLAQQSQGLGFAIGYVGPDFQNIYLAGNLLNQNGFALPFTSDTPFEIASVSKTFTATLYALLIQQVTDPSPVVGDFGLDIAQQFNAIPLVSLINYTSGLPTDNANARDYLPYLAQPYSTQGMLGYLSMNALHPQVPDATYRYSNLAFGIMGAVLPTIAGEGSTFENLAATYIFDRLSMSSKFFDEVRINHLPRGFDYSQNVASPVQPGWPFFPAYNGAGGIVASPNDMMTWLRFNMGLQTDPILSPLLPALQSPSTTVTTPWKDSLGLGWFLTPETTDTFACVWKDGDLAGYSSFMAFLPSSDPGTDASQAGVFFLSNAGGLFNGDAEISAYISYNVLRIMQGLEQTENSRSFPRSSISRHVGATS